MVVKTYQCDVCGEKCKDEDVTTIRLFPRRKYEYATDVPSLFASIVDLDTSNWIRF